MTEPMPRESGNNHPQNRGTMLISGSLIAVLAGVIGVQMWRGQNSIAAEEVGTQRITTDVAMEQPVSDVNGQSISFRQLAEECVAQYGIGVLENLINRTLIQQACAKAGVAVTDTEVNNEVTRISKKFGLAVDQWERMLQQERGLTPLQYRRNVIWPMLALKKLAGQNFEVTREEMQKAYIDNYGPRVKAKMIVMDKLKRATEVWEKLRENPDEFENYARDYSIESNSRALGGAIPPIARYSGAHEEIRKAAYKMKTPGEISGHIIQVDINQYVILKYEGRTEPVDHDPKDVEAQLREQLRESKVQELVAATFSGIRKNARISNYLTNEVATPDTGIDDQLPGNIKQALQP